MVLLSLLALMSKISLRPGFIAISPSVVPPAASRGKRNPTMAVVAMVVVTELGVRCSRRCALSVAKNAKCHSSLGKVDLSTVVIATAR